MQTDGSETPRAKTSWRNMNAAQRLQHRVTLRRRTGAECPVCKGCGGFDVMIGDGDHAFEWCGVCHGSGKL